MVYELERVLRVYIARNLLPSKELLQPMIVDKYVAKMYEGDYRITIDLLQGNTYIIFRNLC